MSEGRKVAAILVANIVGYSQLMGEDEAGTAQAVSEHREAARPMTFNANDLPEQRPPSMQSAMTASRKERPFEAQNVKGLATALSCRTPSGFPEKAALPMTTASRRQCFQPPPSPSA